MYDMYACIDVRLIVARVRPPSRSGDAWPTDTGRVPRERLEQRYSGPRE